MNLLIRGNSKMGNKVFLFNLPAKVTCTPTSWCLEGRDGEPACYALRGRGLWPSSLKGGTQRLELSKKPDFVDKVVESINKKQVKYFRLHSSGDFYSNDYVEKWINIAKQCPSTLFRTTTRRRDLTDTIQELNSLPNFIVRESLDTSRTKPKMDLPFAALSSLKIVKKTDSYGCQNDCPKCNYYCWENSVNVHFKEH